MAKDFSRIVTSTPLDKTAAAVVRPGYHYEPTARIDSGEKTWFEECPEIVPILKINESFERMVDITGMTCGLLKVIGYGGNAGTKNGKGARWVCHCKCGRYCYARSQTLRKRKAHMPLPMCDVCNNAERIRNGFDSRLVSLPGRSTVR